MEDRRKLPDLYIQVVGKILIEIFFPLKTVE